LKFPFQHPQASSNGPCHRDGEHPDLLGVNPGVPQDQGESVLLRHRGDRAPGLDLAIAALSDPRGIGQLGALSLSSWSASGWTSSSVNMAIVLAGSQRS
jgi:hypothetical protein